jgi:hypothetical protein
MYLHNMPSNMLLTKASAKAFSASLDCRRMDSVMSGLLGVCALAPPDDVGVAAVCPRYLGVVDPPNRFGLGSRDEVVLRGMPEERRRPT